MPSQDHDELAEIREPLRQSLRRITERLAGELAQATPVAPDWSPVEWRLARAVAVIHCASPLLAGAIRWSGPAHWKDFLAGQKAQVLARHRRMQALLEQIDAACRTEGLAAVALKGAALHAMGFYSAGERPMADVDLLVQRSDMQRSGRVLQSLGFAESFANWKHRVFVPDNRCLHKGLGEHADNYLKIELHERIAEKLPSRLTDITDSIYPQAPHPGLNTYQSTAALMTHLLFHAAGSMAFRCLRMVHLHDIGLVASRMARSDWDELVNHSENSKKLWWGLPPLQLAARYYPKSIPATVLAALAKRCPRLLRHVSRRTVVSDVSLSYPWIEAFPGILWSRSLGEVAEHIGGRIWPNKEMLRMRAKLVETELAATATQWGRMPQWQRACRWLTSRPLRVDTLHAVRMALAQAD